MYRLDDMMDVLSSSVIFEQRHEYTISGITCLLDS